MTNLENVSYLDQPERFDKHMAAIAARHVCHVKERANIDLDYSIASLVLVENALQLFHEQLHLHKSLKVEALPKLAVAWGAYLGETIKRQHPGQWHKGDGDLTRPLVHEDHATYPCSWAFWRMVNGPEDNIRAKYILSYQTSK